MYHVFMEAHSGFSFSTACLVENAIALLRTFFMTCVEATHIGLKALNIMDSLLCHVRNSEGRKRILTIQR